jgi:pimeloyl-ACP methyl ester carboxylesterase
MQGWPVDREVVADELDAEAAMPSLLARLPELACSVHLRAGDADANVGIAHARALHERLPGSTLDVVAGAAHELFVEDAEGTASWVERLLA